MEPSSAAFSPLRQRMIDDMRLRKMGCKAQIAYSCAVRTRSTPARRQPPPTAPSVASVLLQYHARLRRAAGQDAACVPTTEAGCGTEP